ncbi:MAG: hypothetical protein ACTHKH_16630 [Trinickia sp.]|jgi:predicted aminopeptidase
MNIKALPVLACALVIAHVAFADELHNKAMAVTRALQQSIDGMHLIQAEHGGQFGGHMARAEKLAREAQAERNAALDYYRASHPGWR